MEIMINVDNDKFVDVMEKELKAFTQQELHEIIKECLYQILTDKSEDNPIMKLLIEKNHNFGYSSSYDTYTASRFLKQVAANVDFTELFDDMKEYTIKTVKENYDKLLLDVFKECIAAGLFQTQSGKMSLQENMWASVQEACARTQGMINDNNR